MKTYETTCPGCQGTGKNTFTMYEPCDICGTTAGNIFSVGDHDYCYSDSAYGVALQKGTITPVQYELIKKARREGKPMKYIQDIYLQGKLFEETVNEM